MYFVSQKDENIEPYKEIFELTPCIGNTEYIINVSVLIVAGIRVSFFRAYVTYQP